MARNHDPRCPSLVSGTVNGKQRSCQCALIRDILQNQPVVELEEEIGKPTRCKVWLHGVLVFAGSSHDYGRLER